MSCNQKSDHKIWVYGPISDKFMNDNSTEKKSSVRLSTDENLNTLLESVVNEVTVYAERLGGQIKKMSDIGRALSGVHDLNALLEMIVDQARSFTNADAVTLYIV